MDLITLSDSANMLSNTETDTETETYADTDTNAEIYTVSDYINKQIDSDYMMKGGASDGKTSSKTSIRTAIEFDPDSIRPKSKQFGGFANENMPPSNILVANGFKTKSDNFAFTEKLENVMAKTRQLHSQIQIGGQTQNANLDEVIERTNRMIRMNGGNPKNRSPSSSSSSSSSSTQSSDRTSNRTSNRTSTQSSDRTSSSKQDRVTSINRNINSANDNNGGDDGDGDDDDSISDISSESESSISFGLSSETLKNKSNTNRVKKQQNDTISKTLSLKSKTKSKSKPNSSSKSKPMIVIEKQNEYPVEKSHGGYMYSENSMFTENG